MSPDEIHYGKEMQICCFKTECAKKEILLVLLILFFKINQRGSTLLDIKKIIKKKKI